MCLDYIKLRRMKERGHVCKWTFHEFKNSQNKATKQGPYLIKGKIIKEVSSLFHDFKNSQKKATKQGPYFIKGKIVKEVSSLFP